MIDTDDVTFFRDDGSWLVMSLHRDGALAPGRFVNQSGGPEATLMRCRIDHKERMMKLYFSPGACSLADHIALHEAGLTFEHAKVDLKARKTESGEDFLTINPKGYVPALTLDSGETITENVAILDWVAHQDGALKPAGAMGHTHLLEALAYISTEIHKAFKPFFAGAGDDEKAKAAGIIVRRMTWLADTMKGDFLFGDTVSAADCYLFVMLLWARKNGIEAPARLIALRNRMMERPAVRKAMTHEGLIKA